MRGPEKTCYEFAVFEISIIFPQDYPFKEPIFKFVTQIYHPNVNSLGGLCFEYNGWTPMLTVPKLAIQLYSILADPNPDNPLNFEASTIYKSNPAEFELNARASIRKHAM